MSCTWKHCSKPAAHPQTATNGEVWANLCDQHSAELEAAIGGSDAKLLLRLWVMAGGGAEKMGARMTPGVKTDLTPFFAAGMRGTAEAMGEAGKPAPAMAAPLISNPPNTGHTPGQCPSQ